MPKKDLKVKNKFRGSADSRRAFDRMKKSQPVSDSLSKVRTEAGFVRLLQDFIRLVADNDDMKMSPSQTISALDRVKKSFEAGSVTEQRQIESLREAIREILFESEPATTGTTSAIKAKDETEKSVHDPEKDKEEERKKMASKAFSSNAAKRFIDKIGNQPANKAIGTGLKDVGDALLGSEKMEKKLKGASPGEIERLVRNYGKELKDRVSASQKEKFSDQKGDDNEKKDDKGSMTTQDRESEENLRIVKNSQK